MVASVPSASVTYPHITRPIMSARATVSRSLTFASVADLVLSASQIAASRAHEGMVGAAFCEFLAYEPRTGVLYLRRSGNENNPVYAVNLATGKCDCPDATCGIVGQHKKACREMGVSPETLPLWDAKARAFQLGLVRPLRCKHPISIGCILANLADAGNDVEVVLATLPTELPHEFWALCPSKKSTREVR